MPHIPDSRPGAEPGEDELAGFDGRGREPEETDPTRSQLPLAGKNVTIGELACLLRVDGTIGAFAFFPVFPNIQDQLLDLAQRAIEEHADVFVPFIMPPGPNDAEPTVGAATLKQMLSRYPDLFLGYGELGLYAIDGGRGTDFAPDAELFQGIYPVVREHGLVVYLHPGHNQSDKLANSLAANPDITFIVHGDQIENDIGDLIERYPNIYYTVDALYGDQYLLRPEETIDSFLAATSDYKPLLAADLVKWKSIIEEHPDRFMWGTDRGGSAVWTYDLQVSLRLVDYGRAFIGGLDPDVQERFAYMNAARLLAGLRAEAAGSDEWRRPEAACQRTGLASGSMFAAACEGDAEHLARDPARDSDEPRQTEHAVVQPQQKPQPDAVSTTQLGLPFRIADLDGSSGFFSPFGIVRWSLDRPEYGHSGIDIPLRENATLYAVADARVLSIAPTVDDRPGQIMTILFDLDAPAGEGWGFIYEHVYPLDGVATGMHVARGQAIARTALTPLEANNHLQLSYFFHAFQYTRTHTCWVDWLEVADTQPLVALFAEISGQVGFELAWGTAREEEALPYQALLDERQFPNGPRLCYPPGTDVRER